MWDESSTYNVNYLRIPYIVFTMCEYYFVNVEPYVETGAVEYCTDVTVRRVRRALMLVKPYGQVDVYMVDSDVSWKCPSPTGFRINFIQ